MINKADVINEKIKNLQEEIKKQTDEYNAAVNGIKRLRTIKETALANVNKLDGAIQAFSESVKLIDDSASAIDASAVSGELVS